MSCMLTLLCVIKKMPVGNTENSKHTIYKHQNYFPQMLYIFNVFLYIINVLHSFYIFVHSSINDRGLYFSAYD